MDEKISKVVLNGLGLSEENIRIVINGFSAYLDKYEEDYHYNYKYLPSHLEDFCKANELLPKFGQTCEELINILSADVHFNSLKHQIIGSDQILEFKILFSKSIQYECTRENILEKSILSVPVRNSWINKDYVSIDIRFDFLFRDLHFTKNVYGVTGENIVGLCIDFMNNSYRIIAEKYLNKDVIDLINNIIYKNELMDFKAFSNYLIFDFSRYNNIGTLYEDDVLIFQEGEKDILRIYFNEFDGAISFKKDLTGIEEELNKIVKNNKGDNYGNN